jgi:hypothetical protein
MKIKSLALLVLAWSVSSGALAADLVPQFGYLAPGFVSIQTINMAQFWGPAGLPETGTNYYTSGAPKAGSTDWERFDPLSPYYQVWSGAYVIDNFSAASEWNSPDPAVSDIPNTIQRLILLASVDQIAWLTGFGDPHPKASPEPKSVEVVKDSPRNFTLYVRYDTDSDLGSPNPLFGFYPGYSSFANLVAPNAPVLYEAIVKFTYDEAHQNMLVRYSSNCHWSFNDGARAVTPLEIEVQQGLMMLATTFK